MNTRFLVLIILQTILAIYFWVKVLFAPHEDIVAEIYLTINLVGVIINSIGIIQS